MNHFYTNIHGWFYGEALYSKAVAEAGEGATFVEVGAWKGRSAAYMAVEIVNSGKRVEFHVVDWFKGSDEPEHHVDPDVREDRLFEVFQTNLASVIGIVTVHNMTSLEGSAMFEDNSLDFVFLDAAHDYQSVKDDIEAWLPKVKSGGVLSGDDYLGTFPGVTKAVDEAFEKVEVPNWPIWSYRKP